MLESALELVECLTVVIYYALTNVGKMTSVTSSKSWQNPFAGYALGGMPLHSGAKTRFEEAHRGCTSVVGRVLMALVLAEYFVQ